jgi:hypothetical protein
MPLDECGTFTRNWRYGSGRGKGSGKTHVMTQIDKLLRHGEKNLGISVMMIFVWILDTNPHAYLAMCQLSRWGNVE